MASVQYSSLTTVSLILSIQIVSHLITTQSEEMDLVEEEMLTKSLTHTNARLKRHGVTKFSPTQSDYKDPSRSVRSICAKAGVTIYINCSPDNFSIDLMNLESVVLHGFWKTEFGGVLPQEAVEPRRYSVDDRLILQIRNLKPEDSGFFTCSLIMDTKESKRHSVMLTIYAAPKLGLEFPLMFRFTGGCQKKMGLIKGSSSVLHEMLCGIQEPGKVHHECQYEIGDTTCKARRGSNDTYAYVEMVVRKTPHSNFVAPTCKDDCMRMYYVQHINSNLEHIVRVSKDFHRKFSSIGFIFDFYPTKLLTMRRYFYICSAGFSFSSDCSLRCMPCYPGTYSDAFMNFCEKCQVDSHQEHFGAESCLPCPAGKRTGTKTGNQHESYCYHDVDGSPVWSLVSMAAVLWAAVIILTCIFGIKILLDDCCYARGLDSEEGWILATDESQTKGGRLEDEEGADDVASTITEIEWFSEEDLND